MAELEYYRPRYLKEALEVLDQRRQDAALLSGGTNLLVDWRARKVSPRLLVDIFHLKELDFIEDQGDYLKIGAATTMKSLSQSSIIQTSAKFLGEAASQIGSPQIRNRATLGGNIVSASPAADTLPPLLTLEAILHLKSLKGNREISLESFLRGPNETDIRPNEILTEIRFAKPSPEAIARFFKIGRRNALTISVINLVLLLYPKDGGREIESVRIALGAVAPTPIRATKAENYLRGKPLNEVTIRRAAEMAAEQARPITDLRGTAENRRALVKVWVEKFLLEWLNTEWNE